MALLSVNGDIKIKKETGFCYFSMDLEEIRIKFSQVVKKLNKNLKTENIDLWIKLCKFVNHDGKNKNESPALSL